MGAVGPDADWPLSPCYVDGMHVHVAEPAAT